MLVAVTFSEGDIARALAEYLENRGYKGVHDIRFDHTVHPAEGGKLTATVRANEPRRVASVWEGKDITAEALDALLGSRGKRKK